MSFQEKSAWILVLVSLAVGAIYGQALWQAGGLSAEGHILWAVIIFVVLAAVIHIGIAILFPKAADLTDERDRRIARKGEVAGGMVLGGVMLLIIALSLKDGNWLIANVAFLGLLGSEIIKGLWQITLYRMAG